MARLGKLDIRAGSKDISVEVVGEVSNKQYIQQLLTLQPGKKEVSCHSCIRIMVVL